MTPWNFEGIGEQRGAGKSTWLILTLHWMATGLESGRAVVSHVFIKMNAMVIAHVPVEWLLSGGEGNRLYGGNGGALLPSQ